MVYSDRYSAHSLFYDLFCKKTSFLVSTPSVFAGILVRSAGGVSRYFNGLCFGL